MKTVKGYFARALFFMITPPLMMWEFRDWDMGKETFFEYLKGRFNRKPCPTSVRPEDESCATIGIDYPYV